MREFSDPVHVVDDFTSHASGATLQALTGALPIPVISVWAVDGDGRMTLIHEVYRTRQPLSGGRRRLWRCEDLYGIGVARFTVTRQDRLISNNSKQAAYRRSKA